VGPTVVGGVVEGGLDGGGAVFVVVGVVDVLDCSAVEVGALFAVGWSLGSNDASPTMTPTRARPAASSAGHSQRG
jgi:hypothetical protein